jgi:hypothetical protein
MTNKKILLKGPKHEIFGSGFFFTEIRPVRIGDLGLAKKMKFRKLDSLF